MLGKKDLDCYQKRSNATKIRYWGLILKWSPFSGAYLASLFASQPLVRSMRGQDGPEGGQEVSLVQAEGGEGVPLEEPQPLDPTLVATAASALDDINSRLEDPLTPELASTFSQREMSSLVDGEALRRRASQNATFLEKLGARKVFPCYIPCNTTVQNFRAKILYF